MSNETYHKILKKSEAKYRWWRILKEDRDFFPDENIEFEVKFAGKTYVLKVNYRDNIRTGQFYEKYKFLENDKIIFTRKKENVYLMEAPDTQLWPQV